MKPYVFALLALLSTSAFSQTSGVTGFCEQGAKTATTSSLNSTNKLQGIVPGCTVTVYYTDTSTQVPGSSIFADSIGTILGNPFTANTTTGQYLFYAAQGVGLDVVRSSGTTNTDVVPGVSSGSFCSTGVSGCTLTGPLIASSNTQINIQSGPYLAKCDGITDDTTAIQTAYYAAGTIAAAAIPTVNSSLLGGVNYAQQGTVIFPFTKVCKITSAIIVPPGVKTDLNHSMLQQVTVGQDALRSSYADLTGSPAYYGVNFLDIENGFILGPSASESSGDGIDLYISNVATLKNLEIQGFAFGVAGQEIQYMYYENNVTDGNGTGVYLTARPTATNLTSIDNTFINIESSLNLHYGFWCQACANRGIYGGDISRNGTADIVLGAQAGYLDSTHAEFVTGFSLSGGSGCTPSSNIPITVSGTYGSGGAAAEGYITTNGSGVPISAWAPIGGIGYTGAITASVASGCSSAPTVTPIVENDSSYGLWAGASSTLRGGMLISGVKIEHLIGTDGPAIGWPVLIGYNTNEIILDHLDYTRQQGSAPVPYSADVYNNGIGNVLRDPGDPDNVWDSYVNPAVSAVNGVCMITDNRSGMTLSIDEAQSSSTYTPFSYLCDGAGQLQYNVQLPNISAQNGAVREFSTIQTQGGGTFNPSIQGKVLGDTSERYVIVEDGAMSFGPGNATQDVGLCRSSSGVLSISNGTDCNALGTIAFGNSIGIAQGGTGASSNSVSYTPGTTTLSVANCGPICQIHLSNSGATTITNFTSPMTVVTLDLEFADANTTISNSNAYLPGGGNFTGSANCSLWLTNYAGTWHAIAAINCSYPISATTLTVGGGSTINKEMKGSGTLTYGALTAPICADQPLTITGAAAGDVCWASPASTIGTNFSYSGCYISASNTAQVRVCALVTGTPNAVSWTGWARH
jgi:hypothetical protein